MIYKNKKQCWKCKYGWSINGNHDGKPDNIMCLYFHDTNKHRDNDENNCRSYVKSIKKIQRITE